MAVIRQAVWWVGPARGDSAQGELAGLMVGLLASERL